MDFLRLLGWLPAFGCVIISWGPSSLAQDKIDPAAPLPHSRDIIVLNSPPLGEAARGLDAASDSAVAAIAAEQEDVIRHLSQLGQRKIAARLRAAVNALVVDSLSPLQREEIERRGFQVVRERIYRPVLHESRVGVGAAAVELLTDSQNRPITGQGVRVAVLDTGIDYTRPAFGSCTTADYQQGRCTKVGGVPELVRFSDLVDNDSDPMDDGFHGTAVSDIIAGIGFVKGVATGATIIPFRVCRNGSCSDTAILQALERVLDPNGDDNFSDRLEVVNISLSNPVGDPDDAFSRAIDVLSSQGIIAVIAAGNGGPRQHSITSPGCARSAITVGATGKRSPDPAFFTSTGPVIWQNERQLQKPDLTAPGDLICVTRSSVDPGFPTSLCLNNTIQDAVSGTSFSAPHVAGGVALILQAHPAWTPLQVKTVLQSTARNARLEQYRDVRRVGAGQIDLLRAVTSRNAPPRAELNDIIPNYASGLTSITGTAGGAGFFRYTLTMISPTNQATVLATGTSEVANGVLGTIDLKILRDGLYTFRLVVESSEGESSDLAAFELENVEITSPLAVRSNANRALDGGIVGGRAPLPITGSVSNGTYALKWCQGTNCSTSGIQLLQPTGRKSVIARWDLPSLGLPTGFYSLRLEADTAAGSQEEVVEIFLEADLLAIPIDGQYLGNGYPRYVAELTVADINGDGKEEIIYPYEHQIRVIDGSGRSLPGWPQNVPTIQNCAAPALSTYQVASDLHPSPGLEIAATDSCAITIYTSGGTRITHAPHGAANMMAIRPAGQTRPLIANIHRRTVNYLLVDGRPAPGSWPVALSATDPYTTIRLRLPAALDLLPRTPSRDPERNELSVISYIGYRPNQFSDPAGELVVYAADGAVRPGWPLHFAGAVSSPTAANIFGEREHAILFRELRYADGAFLVHAVSPGGAELPTFPLRISGLPTYRALTDRFSSASDNRVIPADFEFDGIPDFVTVAGGCLYVLSGGTVRSGWPICVTSPSRDSYVLGEPLIANLDRDLEPEIAAFVGYDPILSVLHLSAWNLDRTPVSGFPKLLPRGLLGDGMAVADLDGDGRNELAALEFNTLRIWKLDAPRSPGDQWRQIGGNVLHNGQSALMFRAPPRPRIGKLGQHLLKKHSKKRKQLQRKKARQR